jgi:hypothetical protein
MNCDFATYNIISECLVDYSIMLPFDAMEMYARGELSSSFERLRGPTYYSVRCDHRPNLQPPPCRSQYIYYNIIRDSAQNTFAGWSLSRGPVFLEEDISNYLKDDAKFGNLI